MVTEIFKETEIEAERKILAVAAIIMSKDGRILIVQETENKPLIDKMAGDWTFPTETLKQGEPLLEGLSRLIHEEVGKIKYHFNPKRDWIGDYNVGSRGNSIWARVYLLHFEGTSKMPINFSSIDNEVINHRWNFPRALQTLSRRKGVWEPLKDFLLKRRGVVCQECIPGERW